MTKKEALQRAVIIAEENGSAERKKVLRQNLTNIIKFAIAVAKFATHDRELIIEALAMACMDQGILRSEIIEYYNKHGDKLSI